MVPISLRWMPEAAQAGWLAVGSAPPAYPFPAIQWLVAMASVAVVSDHRGLVAQLVRAHA